MLSQQRGMLSQRGRSSPSFIIAIAGLLIAVLGYGAWTYLRPDPLKVSEQLVRDSRRVFAREVRVCQREADALADARTKDDETILAQVAECVRKARIEIDQRADEAQDALLELDIALRAQRNRSERIGNAAREAKERASVLVEEIRQRLATEPGS